MPDLPGHCNFCYVLVHKIEHLDNRMSDDRGSTVFGQNWMDLPVLLLKVSHVGT